METKQLKGKIFWIEYPFLRTGVVEIPKENETSFTVTLIPDARISKEEIQFFTEPFEWDGEKLSYVVILRPDVTGTGYSGEYKLRTDLDSSGVVTCELFENDRAYLLKGTWEEYGTYTWFARIEKPKY